MKRRIAFAIISAISIGSVGQSHANSLNLATGLNSVGNLQTAGGSLDANWTVTGAINPLQQPNAYVVDQTDGDWSSGCGGLCAWLANGPNSSWIAANPFDGTANGPLTFTLSFNVSDPSTASIINGAWAVDDFGTLSLNGNLLSTWPYLTGSNGGGCCFSALVSFSTVPSDFVAGVNTLVMQITSTDNFLEGGRLEGELVTSQTPLPTALPLFATGIGGLGLLSWRRKRKQAA